MYNFSSHCILVELAFDTVIVKYTIHGDIPNCTKLAFNSLKMILNDTVSQAIKQGMLAFN